jgi:hypothetical protein
MNIKARAPRRESSEAERERTQTRRVVQAPQPNNFSKAKRTKRWKCDAEHEFFKWGLPSPPSYGILPPNEP